MTETAAASTTAFTIDREFAAPRELVWRAWTDPSSLASWFGPRGLTSPRERISVDLRPGGTWTITMIADADGAEYPQTFTYLEIVEPERLVFGARAGGVHDTNAVVTLTLLSIADRTRMTFTVENLTEGEALAGLKEGWASSFECLADALDGARDG